jgi:hypothetical protein
VDLEKTFGAISDYYKFLITLWAGYIGICTVSIGWLTSQRAGGHPLDWQSLLILIASFIVVSVIFYRVLSQYHNFLKKMLTLADEYARDEARRPKEATDKKSQGEPRTSASGIDRALLDLFDRQPGIRALDKSLGFVWWTASIVVLFMLALNVF